MDSQTAYGLLIAPQTSASDVAALVTNWKVDDLLRALGEGLPAAKRAALTDALGNQPLNELARSVWTNRAAANQSSTISEIVFPAMTRQLTRLMASQCQRRTGGAAPVDELCEEAASFGWEILQSWVQATEDGEGFINYLCVAFNNLITDRLKKRSACLAFDSIDSDSIETPACLISFTSNGGDQLPAEDLCLIQKWRPEVRLYLLARAALLHRVPKVTVIADLLALAGNHDQADALREYPPEQTLPPDVETHLDQFLQRFHELFVAGTTPGTFVNGLHQVLSEQIGYGPNAASRLWDRNRWRLFELKALQDVIMDPPAGPEFFERLFDKARANLPTVPKEDLSFIETRWKNRAFLLAMAGLWDRIDRETWHKWVTDDETVKPPFPPNQLTEELSSEEKARILATVMDTRNGPTRLHNTLWRCQQPRFVDLRCISRLIERTGYES